mmetsp:Transcript_3069/g.8343  ORF Transcript_3069/g.8343 Transcript_3069/m.8343 type:complete len:224 (-) Transcript_3069:43-714(-)
MPSYSRNSTILLTAAKVKRAGPIQRNPSEPRSTSATMAHVTDRKHHCGSCSSWCVHIRSRGRRRPLQRQNADTAGSIVPSSAATPLPLPAGMNASASFRITSSASSRCITPFTNSCGKPSPLTVATTWYASGSSALAISMAWPAWVVCTTSVVIRGCLANNGATCLFHISTACREPPNGLISTSIVTFSRSQCFVKSSSSHLLMMDADVSAWPGSTNVSSTRR